MWIKLESGTLAPPCHSLSSELLFCFGTWASTEGGQETAPETCAVRAISTLLGDIAFYVPQCSHHASSVGRGPSGLRA